MQQIELASVSSNLDFDHGEGWIIFSWVDSAGIDRELTIDFDGHCSREWPIQSGTGFGFVDVRNNSIHLSFNPELASKLGLDPDVTFTGEMPDNIVADLHQLAAIY